jgi:hypothetical protein
MSRHVFFCGRVDLVWVPPVRGPTLCHTYYLRQLLIIYNNFLIFSYILFERSNRAKSNDNKINRFGCFWTMLWTIEVGRT